MLKRLRKWWLTAKVKYHLRGHGRVGPIHRQTRYSLVWWRCSCGGETFLADMGPCAWFTTCPAMENVLDTLGVRAMPRATARVVKKLPPGEEREFSL